MTLVLLSASGGQGRGFLELVPASLAKSVLQVRPCLKKNRMEREGAIKEDTH